MSADDQMETREPILSSMARTFDEVDEAFKDAHVEVEKLKPVYQSLWFAETHPTEDNLFLFELDKNLLNILKEGQSLVLRGDEDDQAVLCTDNQTFSLQVAEISNSLTLVPDIVWLGDANGSSENRIIQNKLVQKTFFEYFEVQPSSPKLSKLLSLLEPSCYKGPNFEESYKTKGVEFKSTRDLLMRVQASESELLQALKNNNACFLNGHWRLLDRDHHHTLLSHFLQIISDNSWGLNEIVMEEAVEILQKHFPDEPVEVLNHILEWYCEKTDNFDAQGRNKCSLRKDRVCRFLGEILLRLAAKFNLNEFLTAWQETVPAGMEVDLKYLEGIALKDEKTKPPSIFFFPEWELPEDISERIKVLFATKQKWFLDEIKPYIQNLTTERMNVNALLTKHALGSTVDGKRCFSARHGK